MKQVLIVVFFITLFSCSKSNKHKVDVSKVNVKFDLVRFEKEFYSANNETLSGLKNKYPYLFSAQVADSVWLNRIQHKDERALFKATDSVFSDFSASKQEILSVFKHIKYYNKGFRAPKVFTIITNVKDRVVYADSLLFVSLDNFLGKSHEFYKDYPEYVREKNTKKHLSVAVAKAITERFLPGASLKKKFVERMIYEGKKMYFLDCILPETPDFIKIGYAQIKYNWAKENEWNVWRYFVDKSLLYKTDFKLLQRFIYEAPFSKFYLAHDNKTPGEIGVYIGWKIVRSYMNNNDVSLHKMMVTDELQIFKNSNYKPK